MKRVLMGDGVFGAVRAEVPAALCAALISFFLVTGFVFSQADAARGWALPQVPVLGVVAAFLLCVAILYLLIRSVFGWLQRNVRSGGRPLDECGALARWWVRHPFVAPFAILCVCWLPYLIVYFPGSFPWDGVRSMNQFITDAPLENHHPVPMNLLYAGTMTLGRLIRSDNLGLLLIVLVQSVACAAAFAASLSMLVRARCPRWLCVAGLLYFALDPVWGIFAQAAFKDTLFNGVFCWFFICLVVVLRGSLDGKSCALLALSSLAVCFVRNNGVYIVVPTLLVAAAYGARKVGAKEAWAKLGSMAVGVGVVVLVCLKVIYPACGIDAQESKEMLSVPFQQTARYLLEHPDDVTDQERAAIDAILPYDQLAEIYVPDLADPVKEAYERPADESKALKDYFCAWASMGLRHPGSYLRAFIAQVYAYFYPGIIIGPQVDRQVLPLNIQGVPINQDFQVHHVLPDEVPAFMTKVLEQAMLTSPFTAWIFSPAPYLYLFIILFFFAVRMRAVPVLLLSVALWLLLLSVLLGPLNGHLRYILPIAAVLPLYAGCPFFFAGGARQDAALVQ